MSRDTQLDKSQFYHPKDKLTTLYNQVMANNDKLPPTFYNNKTAESYGIGNLEIKKPFLKPMKRKPLYSKLSNGEYQTDKSKSDISKISKDISFFRNNLPSFLKYKSTDDLTWVINEHRKLLIEMLQYYSERPTTSLTTIEGRIVGIMRVFYIAYETKNYELYKKYSILVFDLRDYFKLDENKQELNPREEKAFVPFEVILGKQKQLQEEFKEKGTYKLNQDLVLVSLYSLIPPNRDEIKELYFTTTPKTDRDYIYFGNDGNVMLLLNKIKKKHESIKYNLSEESKQLANILIESYERFPREAVFTQYSNRKVQIKVGGINKRLISIFKFTNKNVGTNSIRSSYATYRNQSKQLSVAEKDALAKQMRTSRRYLDEHYIKLAVPNEYKNKEVVIIKEVKPQPTNNRYGKHLETLKRYYERNKTEIIERVKQNYHQKDKAELARKKLIYYLNNDENYKNRIKRATIDKYNIRLVNGVYL